MTISPSLNSQFNVLVNLAVVTNIIPYILSMAALVIIQKVANVPPSKAKVANFVALLARCTAFMRCTHPGKKPCCTVPS
ncbi:putrescine/proton symporter: putrescine/ornithine antiporter [Escherichia coli]|uniref:Putrescine/proton symporter: putrescine/ornithine antiporter n=1 Tax=Escherichia coli TaxID=562 RepID=A0A376MTE6_ECOLX|nr:putrescine/proton symporter: putrescine/ornithine antiporter [Escherichia coli]